MVGHIVDCIVTLAALVAILDYFGVKPKRPLCGLAMPLSRNWKLGVMLTLVAASLGMTGYGFYRSIRPKVIEKVVEKPVDRVIEKLVPQECPQHQTAKDRKKDKSTVRENKPIPLSPGVGSIQQSNSGGLNVQQATTGNDSPIIDSPVTIGNVPKRISPQDMATITRFLAGAPIKAHIRISFDQNSNVKAFAEDLYKALKDAGWPMQDVGVQGVIVLFPPGSKFQGVEFIVKGEPLKPNEQVETLGSDPLFYVGKVSEMLKSATLSKARR